MAGFVVNGPEGVTIEIEGDRVSEFVAALPLEAPPLARIDHICVQETRALAAKDFSIGASESGKLSTRIAADAATCPQCLSELFDPENRTARARRRRRAEVDRHHHAGQRSICLPAQPYEPLTAQFGKPIMTAGV
ncbi:hypothetical protein ACVWW1_004564 [Bradyrhizobium sp. JR3.5]